MYRVLIVEDDPMVASIDRSYVERTADFTVVAVCKNGVEALELFKTEEIDLVVLDYYTPGMNGDEFLDKLHETGMRPEVIMVTSANSVEIVQELLSRGISDYLVKPFEYDRFREGLERFRRRREVLQDAGTGMRQEEIDRMLSRGAAERLQDSEPLPKGMNRQTLSLVREYLRNHLGQRFTSEAIATQIGLSRTTVRRYVSVLVERGELTSTIDYQTGGRPGILYQYREFQ